MKAKHAHFQEDDGTELQENDNFSGVVTDNNNNNEEDDFGEPPRYTGNSGAKHAGGFYLGFAAITMIFTAVTILGPVWTWEVAYPPRHLADRSLPTSTVVISAFSSDGVDTCQLPKSYSSVSPMLLLTLVFESVSIVISLFILGKKCSVMVGKWLFILSKIFALIFAIVAFAVIVDGNTLAKKHSDTRHPHCEAPGSCNCAPLIVNGGLGYGFYAIIAVIICSCVNAVFRLYPVVYGNSAEQGPKKGERYGPERRRARRT